uniref:DUF4325 domain-containing protein n=1 Tax=Heterorhabditis bacteriophora TaxID=37862 RepID=A0A1I7XR20_HETBA
MSKIMNEREYVNKIKRLIFTESKVVGRAFVDVSETDNATAIATIEMLRLAELFFNSRSDISFDVLLGTRALPPFESSSLQWNLHRIGITKHLNFTDRTLRGMFEYLNDKAPEYNLFIDNYKVKK